MLFTFDQFDIFRQQRPLDVADAELPKEDQVEDKAEQEEDDENFGPVVETPAGNDGQMVGLKMNQHLRPRQACGAAWNWAFNCNKRITACIQCPYKCFSPKRK